jgi:hypothetical protein
MVVGLRGVANDDLPFGVLRAIVVLLWGRWGKDRERQAAHTSTRSTATATARDGCSCQFQIENEYRACKRSHLRFLLFG